MTSATDERDARFAVWLKEHRGIPMKLARAYAANSSDQSDLYQEMLLQIWRSLASFRNQAKESTWIYRVCLNTALSWRRSERRRHSRILGAESLPEVASVDARPGSVHKEQELLARLYAAIREMEPVDRSLLLMSLDGLSYREISEITDMSENHVGVALSRARDKLGERLKGVRNELE